MEYQKSSETKQGMICNLCCYPNLLIATSCSNCQSTDLKLGTYESVSDQNQRAAFTTAAGGSTASILG